MKVLLCFFLFYSHCFANSFCPGAEKLKISKCRIDGTDESFPASTSEQFRYIVSQNRIGIAMTNGDHIYVLDSRLRRLSKIPRKESPLSVLVSNDGDDFSPMLKVPVIHGSVKEYYRASCIDRALWINIYKLPSTSTVIDGMVYNVGKEKLKFHRSITAFAFGDELKIIKEDPSGKVVLLCK